MTVLTWGASKLQRDKTNIKLLVGVFYSPPNSKKEEETCLLLQLEMAWGQGNVLIMGDFNHSDLYWANGNAHSTKACHFFTILHINFMIRMGKSLNRDNVLLGILITNNIELIADVEMMGNLGNSDYRLITNAINYRKVRQKGRSRTLHFKRDNFTKMCSTEKWEVRVL